MQCSTAHFLNYTTDRVWGRRKHHWKASFLRDRNRTSARHRCRPPEQVTAD